jgi:non-specific serine/threonine protein kinase
MTRSGGGTVNIPSASGRFVGRTKELARLRARLGRERLVTIHGSAGAGKTRLAIEYASAAAPSLSGRVWFVNLGALTATELLAEAVASTLGINATLDDPASVVGEFLGEAPSLLLLDNCEHVVEEVAALVDDLLGRAPSLRILATSREELRLPREYVLRIAGLDTSRDGEAIALFADRARRGAPGFRPDEQTRTAVEGICALLDGLPLAIELAAARMTSVTPQQLLEYLNDPMALLEDSTRDTPHRASSLRASIDLTYRLCDAAEQRAWERLSSLRSTFAVEDAAAILQTSLPESLAMIDRLLSKSVLARAEQLTGRARFRMLFVLRAFGRDRLRDSEGTEVVDRVHAEWFAGRAADLEEHWIAADQDVPLQLLEESLPDVRATIQYALDSGRPDLVFRAAVLPTPQLWWAGGKIDEGRYWVEKATQVVGGADRDHVLTLIDAATLALAKGDAVAARAHIAAAESLVERSSADATPRALSDLAFGIAFEHLMSGRFADCVEEARRGLGLLPERPLLPTHFRLRQLLVYAGNGLGDYRQGELVCDELIELSEAADETYYRAFALHNLALYAWRAGDLDRAQQLSDEGMRLSVHVPNRPENPDALLIAALIAAERQHTERAATLFGAALGTSRTRVASTAQFARSHEDAERLEDWHAKIREVLHPAATVRGYRMTPAEAVAFAIEAQQRPRRTGLLTPREREVVALVADGATNRQIASALRITVRTAEGHVERIRRKLEVHSRVEIGTWYVREALHDI